MKTWKDVAEAIRNGKKISVEFRKPIEDQEGYLEAGMRATLVSFVEEDDSLVKFVGDLASFNEHNRGLESANYYDKSHNPTLTAREAGFYPKDDLQTIWAGLNDPIDQLAEILLEDQVALYREFKAGSSSASYVAWLETQVHQLRGDKGWAIDCALKQLSA